MTRINVLALISLWAFLTVSGTPLTAQDNNRQTEITSDDNDDKQTVNRGDDKTDNYFTLDALKSDDGETPSIQEFYAFPAENDGNDDDDASTASEYFEKRGSGFEAQMARGFGKRGNAFNGQMARGFGKRAASFGVQMARGFGKRNFQLPGARGFGK